MKVITFVLPNYSRVPIGGYKIVFEYANRLVEDGFKVKILFLNDHALEKYRFPRWIKKIVINLLTHIEPRWFHLNRKIKKRSGININRKINADIVIATSATTVDYVNSNFESAKKIYLIQDFENWNMSSDKLYATYKLGFQNIVVAKWLKEIVDKYSKKPAIYIQNPINVQKYKVYTPIKKRNPFNIGMLYHVRTTKGSIYAIEALKKVHELYPQLIVNVFGTSNRPNNLPIWFKYTKDASQKQTINIYNNISIFVNSSIKEGFGLTGLEAMACGAALVSTSYDGVKEYAENNVDSLLSPIRDSEALAKNIVSLIENQQKRIKLAEEGQKRAQNFSWDNSYSKFKKVILNLE